MIAPDEIETFGNHVENPNRMCYEKGLMRRVFKN
jgi:hypothetical protein